MEKEEINNKTNILEEVVNRISDSQDLNSKEVFEILKKEMELTNPSEEYSQCIKQVLKDHSKVLDGELTFEQEQEILDNEMEIFRTANERERERIQSINKIEKKALDKDTEKTEFNWSLIKTVSFFLIGAVAGTIAGVIGGKYIEQKNDDK